MATNKRPKSIGNFALVWTIAAIIVMPLGTRAAAFAKMPVPVIACSGSEVFPRGGEQTPLPSPMLPKSGVIQADVSQADASKLDAYIYAHGMLLAPRQWHCEYSVSGGYGYTVSIKPSVGNYSVSETFEFADGYEAATAYVSEWADTYFPKIVQRLSPNTVIQIDNGHNWTQSGAFAFPAYKTDHIRYLSDMKLVFATPAGRLGVGSQFFSDGPENHPVAQDFPINGFITLSAELSGNNTRLCRLVIFDLALPEALYSLESAILNTAESAPEAQPDSNNESC